MDLLTNPVKEYDWGTRTDLAALLGLAPDRPRAELWLGTHPSGPSTLVRAGHTRTLAEVVAADPARELGAGTVGTFGPRLPYLLKLLSARQPLSLQVHPSAEQARRGHDRGDPHYPDPWDKPEMAVALTTFDALAGMRPPAESADLVNRLGLRRLAPVVDTLAGGDPPGALSTVLTWPQPDRRCLVTEVADACVDLAAEPAFAVTAQLAVLHPDDPAVLAPLLLNHHRLAPGEALYLPAGVLHTYLRGFAVEVMGASDNVLRAGLTSKPVDVAALLSVIDASAQPRPVTPDADGAYRPGCPQFRLHHLTPATPRRLTGAWPRILLCTHGTVTADGTTLHAGQSLWLPAHHDSLTVTGEGTAYCAEPGI
ncbi:mannose-6-phosphate isomerase, class I [Catellatospora methionotrophica]|uniref:mannose-6-phosphate isomerase, class I n=1 Tax=Catellatospora methionotrophica TaxID=121620 RepID=UPI0033E68DC9